MKTVGSGSEEDIDVSNEGRYRQRLSTFAANWRALALRGLVALLFGLVVLFWPGLVFAVLALLFGIYAVVDGAITFVPALRSSERGARRWLPLTEGAVGVIAGLIALLLSGMTANGLVYVIVGWALATGMLKILTAIVLRAEVENGWLLAGSGALSVLFGVLLAVLAGSDVPFLIPLIGAFAVIVGLALIVFAFRLRDRRRRFTGSRFYPYSWTVLQANECSSPSRAGKSPRGYVSVGDDPSPCWGLCSGSVILGGSKRETGSKGRCEDRPAQLASAA
jgi:uncharacterized membrane protein HdeD (DUF308 family)